jgi:xanthine dehydrogenase accessory factor
VLSIYEEIVRIQRDGGSAALATVIQTLGSTPGKTTMKLLVHGDGRFLGSVGGGCVEAEVIDRGREVARTERSQRFAVDLNENDNPETGLVCGGRIEIFIEPITMPNVIVFGAGHVARAVCAIAVPAGFRFVVADDRAEYPTADRFPLAAAHHTGAWDDIVDRLEFDPADFVLVMTRGHKDDLSVLRAIHRKRCAVRYLGLIGSKSKLLTLAKHLRGEGMDQAFLESIKTPIGLPIGARTAEEIAISVVAELIQLRRLAPNPAS